MGAVIYQIYPRSFHDSNGDGVGDLAGIAAKLDYVASLGVDAIWLSPFFVSPMRDFGYDVADHAAVDPIFGTLADFDHLLRRAHALGLKVIVDLVCGHTSDQHRWFQESRLDRRNPHAEWYVWADPRPDGTPPSNWLSVFGGAAWSWEPRRRQYYLHHFLASQPSLNLRHPRVIEAIAETAAFWLARGVDGFRLDAIDFLLHDPMLRDNPPRPALDGQIPAKPFGLQHHLYDMMQEETPAVLTELRAIAERRGGTVLLGEVSSQDGAYQRIARYTGRAGPLHIAYSLRPMRHDDVAESLRLTLQEIVQAEAGDGVCWAFSNHDVERAASRWNPGAKRGEPPNGQFVVMLLALLMSLRGTICLYQGEELGLGDAELGPGDLRDPFGIAYYPEFRGRDGSRTPLPWHHEQGEAGFTTGRPWLPIPNDHRRASVSRQEAVPESPLQMCRRLIAWRKSHPALCRGDLGLLDLPEPLIGFVRSCAEERVAVILNSSDRSARVPFRTLGITAPLEDHGLPLLVDAGEAILPGHGMLVGNLERTVQQLPRREAAGR